MEKLNFCNISQRMGAEMHTDQIMKWIYEKGLDESLIEANVKYKVWLEVIEKEDRNQDQEYTCKVYCVEKVPQEILEAEKLIEKYWAKKEPNTEEPDKSVKLIGILGT